MSTAPSLQLLMDVLDKLLAPEGCPWDKEQTPQSLCEYIIEESHELVDAIRHGKDSDVREELGDVLFLLTFVSKLYEKKGSFILDDAAAESAAKMIRRHPHVFEGKTFGSHEEQIAEWNRIKREEKAGASTEPEGTFTSLSASLPPLTKAYRIHAKAATVGFTWDDDEDVERQVEAEWLELLDAISSKDKEAQERELGDMLFTLVELGRRKGIKAAAALAFANQKFVNRFQRMEELSTHKGPSFASVSMEEKNALWDAVKNEEKENQA